MKQTKSGFPAPLRSLCGVAVLFLAACGSPDASSGRNEKGRTEGASLRMITSFRINNLGPTDPRAFFLPEFGVAELPLRLEADGQLRPWLLESFERIDPRNWRLRLRPNVTFQNGRPLTAKAMAAAMNRQLEQCASAKATLPGAKVSTSGERELTLTTAEPDATTPNALADELVFPIYDVDAVEAAGKDASRLVGSGCFTGPYKVVSLDEREMRMTRHDQYWRGLPPLTSVSLRFVADGQARILAAQNDEVDIALYPPSEAQRILAGRSDAFLKTSS
ncbi:MAG TPA: ABC transporter substrate-binding protein, partial [Blastocatellia bacterium]|nr:ABC transporter substrate-binding protein [Blastocatellia bacterium]